MKLKRNKVDNIPRQIIANAKLNETKGFFTRSFKLLLFIKIMNIKFIIETTIIMKYQIVSCSILSIFKTATPLQCDGNQGLGIGLD